MIRSCAIVLLAAALGGCVDNANQRLMIGEDVTLASLPPEVVEPTIDEDGNTAAPEPPADDAPTAGSLDRSNFEPVIYRVPIDGTRHEFHGFGQITLTSETARQRGEFPTARTALETGGMSSTRDQIGEIIFQPVFIAADVADHGVALIWPEWLAAHFVSGMRTSPGGYERAPASAETARLGVIHEPIEERAIDAGHSEPGADQPSDDAASG